MGGRVGVVGVVVKGEVGEVVYMRIIHAVYPRIPL